MLRCLRSVCGLKSKCDVYGRRSLWEENTQRKETWKAEAGRTIGNVDCLIGLALHTKAQRWKLEQVPRKATAENVLMANFKMIQFSKALSLQVFESGDSQGCLVSYSLTIRLVVAHRPPCQSHWLFLFCLFSWWVKWWSQTTPGGIDPRLPGKWKSPALGARVPHDGRLSLRIKFYWNASMLIRKTWV